jgi:hypothetical protein
MQGHKHITIIGTSIGKPGYGYVEEGQPVIHGSGWFTTGRDLTSAPYVDNSGTPRTGMETAPKHVNYPPRLHI